MYEQSKKPRKNENLAIANSTAQKKSQEKQGLEIVDNRPESISQRKLSEMAIKNARSQPPNHKKRNVEMPSNNESSTVQRVLEIDGEVFDDEDTIRDRAFEESGATAESVEGLVYVGTDPEVIARFDSWEEANAQYDGPGPMDPLALAHDPEDPVEIPPLIHFIWVGRPPGAGAIENILSWAHRARNTAWRIVLWTDSNVNLGNWGPTIEQLRGHVEIAQIRPYLDPRLETAYIDAVEGKPKAFNLASDVARYSILARRGGVYADVDLGPGHVDLTRIPVMSSIDIPITAPQIRDEEALSRQLSQEELSLPLAQQVDLAASRAYNQNQLNNNLIIISSHSDFIHRLIERVSQRITEDRQQGGRAEWSNNAALISGPQQVILTMFEMLGPATQRLIDEMEPRTFQNWCRLQWLTAESESQHYDTSGAESPEKSKNSGSDDRCFLTTTCVEVMGLADNCEELTILREFRDGYMRTQADGIKLIEEYYRIAPGIVAALKKKPQFREIAIDLYDRLVLGSIKLIQSGQDRKAMDHYSSYVRKLQKEVG